jgi:hypothetical protein
MILTASASFAQEDETFRRVTDQRDDNTPDTLYIDRVYTEKGAQVALKVDFVNDEELAALTIPLSIVGDLYLIDSVSFIGSRVEYLKMRPVTIYEGKKQVVFGAICMTEDYIQPGRGLMATVYLSPSNTAKEKYCMVDTTTLGPASLLFTKISSASFIPEFIPGMVSHEAPPAETAVESSEGKEQKAKEDESK